MGSFGNTSKIDSEIGIIDTHKLKIVNEKEQITLLIIRKIEVLKKLIPDLEKSDNEFIIQYALNRIIMEEKEHISLIERYRKD